MFFLGVIIIGVWGWGIVTATRQHNRIDRERFERTNSSGVLIFDSYEEKKDFERRERLNEALNKVLAFPGGPLALVGLLMLFAPILD
ncbi:hypothetical protein EGT36_28255 [Agrobacterium sp. FDAARGOS_525]|nr:hypothetical protein EGT36_28255 [Agrobacterium sp. FDAARGOS_525]